MEHELKCRSYFFRAILEGRKRFEIRECRARTFSVGDILHLREWDGSYSGLELKVCVTFVLDHNEFIGIAPGYVIMSF